VGAGEHGAFRFTDRVADYVPEFSRNGKGDISILQLMTHRAGFPTAVVPPAVWEDHACCGDGVQFQPGMDAGVAPALPRRTAHWTPVLIEAVTGKDFRESFAKTHRALGLQDDIIVGMPRAAMVRAADMHEPGADG